MNSPSEQKTYPGYELSIPQLLYALRTKLEHGELLRTTKSDQSKISEIEDAAHRVCAHVRFALNWFAPINRCLPPEILGIIPSFLVHDRDRIITTHVCRRWRTIFLSTPSLWNNIGAFRHQQMTEAYVERSRNLPLDVSISCNELWEQGASASFRMLGSLSSRFRTARFLSAGIITEAFDIIQDPCPSLVELYLELPYGESFPGIDDLSNKFPSLKSLTLIGDAKSLRFSQPFNLRKLGVGYDGSGIPLASLLQLLEMTPLLEEFEFHTSRGTSPIFDLADAQTPVELKHLQRLVFRGVRSDFPRTLGSLITYPNRTKVVLTHYLLYNTLKLQSVDHPHGMFPPGMQLPIPTPPKSIRFRTVQDGSLSETRCSIDLVSVDNKHISIENRCGWPDKCSSQEVRSFALEEFEIMCLKFLRTLDLSSVERFCIQQSSPDPVSLGEVMEEMINLRTLVVVNSYPCGILMGLEVDQPPTVRCPLLRRLVVRQDCQMYMHWGLLVPVVRDRTVHGSPLERVTLTSSFNELPEEPEYPIQELERTAKVTYDFGRNTFGWEWWEV